MEEWKQVEEFDNYEVSNLGKVRNKTTKNELSKSLSSHGYYQVNIGNTTRRIHRLIAIAFIANPHNLETINHIDGDKLNNSIDNLEWMSRGDNVKHSREVLGKTPIPYSKSDKPHHLLGKVGTKSSAGKPVIAELSDGTIKKYGSACQAAQDLFGDRGKGQQIRQSIKRNSKSYKNIKFREDEVSTT